MSLHDTRPSALANEAGQELLIERTVDAPREIVWRAWTEPEHFMRWWGPNTFTTPHCTIDLRVGGTFHYCMRSPEGQEFWGGGVYQEIVAPARLAYLDYFADEHGNPVPATHYGMSPDWPMEALTTVTLEDVAGQTHLTLRCHVGSAPAAEREMAHQGWNESLDRLGDYVSKS